MWPAGGTGVNPESGTGRILRSARATPQSLRQATGIPVSQLTEQERERLIRLEEQLHFRVIGQQAAVSRVAEAIRRSRAGLGDSPPALWGRRIRLATTSGPDRSSGAVG